MALDDAAGEIVGLRAEVGPTPLGPAPSQDAVIPAGRILCARRDRLARRIGDGLSACVPGSGPDQVTGESSLQASLRAAARNTETLVHLFSMEALTDEASMCDITCMMSDQTARTHYIANTIPIFLVESEPSASDLCDPAVQAACFDYWLKRTELLELALLSLDSDCENRSQLLGRVDRLNTSLEFFTRFLRVASGSSLFLAATPDLEFIRARLRSLAPTVRFRDSNGMCAPRAARAVEAISARTSSKREKPEFPPFSPCFPATPTHRVDVPELGRSILIKDESFHFTGSHKNRMAWEVVVFYRNLIEDRLAAGFVDMPSPSLISNGSAATAVQLMLRCFGLPDLKVLLDRHVDSRVPAALLSLGCEVFIADLADQAMDSRSILEATDNHAGIDLTNRRTVDPTFRNYYRWLSYEVFSSGARHIFVPVGTGDLFVNILRLLADQVSGTAVDREREMGRRELAKLEVYGATARQSDTAMTTLFATHRPSLKPAEALASELKSREICGKSTGIYDVDEGLVERALAIAEGNGVRCNASGIAGLSLLLGQADQLELPGSEEILVVNTGWMPLPGQTERRPASQ